MNKMWIRLVQLFIITAGVLSCTGANIYKDMASNKTSDAALYEDAQKLIDSGDYSGAITKLLATSTTFQAEAKTKETLAGAYAARCGMVFLTYVSNLGSSSSSSLFTLAMNGFVGVDTSNYADCQSAETLIESIGAIGVRTSSQNLFLMVLELAKMGNRIRATADISPTSVGDGTVDGTFDCRDSVPIADAKEIINSFYKFVAQAAVVGSGVLGSGLTSAIAGMGTLPSIDYSGGTDPAAADEADPIIIFTRAMINTSTVGVGSCNDANPLNCVCPP